MLLLVATLLPAGASEPARPFMAYHESWWEPPALRAESTSFASLPPYITLLALSFARPDAVYAGDLRLEGTGLQYSMEGPVLREAIALAKRRQPGLKVLLAVGGSGYTNWEDLDEAALVRLVQDLGLDGIDLDYEPEEPQCASTADGELRCYSDEVWLELFRRLRAALPRPYLLTVPGWSTGAYGEGAWAEALPPGAYRGSMLNPLRAPDADAVDLVSIMAYEAGPDYDPWQAYQAYRSIWSGPLLLGVQVPPSLSGGPHYTLAMAEALAARIAADPQGGVMLYGLLARAAEPPTPDNPDGYMLAAALCRGLGLPDCGP